MVALVLHITAICYWMLTKACIQCKPLFNVYMSDQLSELQLQNHCFYYHVTNAMIANMPPMKPILEIIEYCLRPENTTSIENFHNSSNQTIWTFDKLYKQQISSEKLYAWSAPIDTIERYQDYLNDPSTNRSRQTFYNCTYGFGRYCHYAFESLVPFHEIVTNIFEQKRYDVNEETLFPCYMHLPTCSLNHSIVCLDWR